MLKAVPCQAAIYHTGQMVEEGEAAARPELRRPSWTGSPAERFSCTWEAEFPDSESAYDRPVLLPRQAIFAFGAYTLMDLNRFTEKAREALAGAQKLAARLNHQQIDVEHLLLSLLDQEKGLAAAILNKAGVSVDALTIKLQRELEKLPRVTGPSGAPRPVYVTGRFNKLLAQAEDEAKKLKDEYVSVEHLLLAADRRHAARPGKHAQGVRRHPRPAA